MISARRVRKDPRYTRLRVIVVALTAVIAFAQPARAQVRVTMHDGHVTLTATNATVRQILTEWARVGQTKIINGEQVSGTPVTLAFSDVPEDQALDIVLRSVSGYLAAPRPTPLPNLSRYDRIVVMAASAPPRATATSAPPPPAFGAPRPPGVPAISDDDAFRNTPPPAPPLLQQPPNGLLNPPPAANTQDPAGAPVSRPATSPGTFGPPTGVSTPGMVVPAPAPATPTPASPTLLQTPRSFQPGH
jgi:hypothetical protein